MSGCPEWDGTELEGVIAYLPVDEWVELTDEYLDVFDYGQALGGTPPEQFISDGAGHYLNAVIPEIRDLSDDNMERFSYLLDLFWAGWAAVNHHWDEESHV